MKRTNFIPVFSDTSEYCEKTSSKPVNSFIPHQAITIKELVSRFERGQRLNVHANFHPGDNMYQATDEQAMNDIVHGDPFLFDQAPPDDVHDVVDVHEYYKQHQHQKQEREQRLIDKRKQKTQQAQQVSTKQASQVSETLPDSATPPA